MAETFYNVYPPLLIATAELRVEWRVDQVRASFSEVWSPQQLCIAHSVQRGATHHKEPHVGNIKSNIIQSLDKEKQELLGRERENKTEF